MEGEEVVLREVNCFSLLDPRSISHLAQCLQLTTHINLLFKSILGYNNVGDRPLPDSSYYERSSGSSRGGSRDYRHHSKPAGVPPTQDVHYFKDPDPGNIQVLSTEVTYVHYLPHVGLYPTFTRMWLCYKGVTPTMLPVWWVLISCFLMIIISPCFRRPG